MTCREVRSITMWMERALATLMPAPLHLSHPLHAAPKRGDERGTQGVGGTVNEVN